MDNILGYLKKYQDRLVQTKRTNSEVAKVIKEIVGLELLDDEFNISNNNLYLKTSTKVKLSILLQKELIIERINQDVGRKIILNIK